MAFKVIDIINGNTIRVNGWEWTGHKGQEVEVNGINVQKTALHPALAEEICKGRLNKLLLNQEVTLHAPVTLINAGKIRCNVNLNGVNINTYFPDFR